MNNDKKLKELIKYYERYKKELDPFNNSIDNFITDLKALLTQPKIDKSEK